MSDPGSLIPSDEQSKAIQEGSKAIQEALKTLQGIGGFLRETFGTVPEDIVGLLGGDWLRVRRTENLFRMFQKARERLKARGVEMEEPASLSITLPIFVAAAEESRDELQDLWARLLAAAADPSRAGHFRLRFIEATKRMDPLDAAVLSRSQQEQGVSGTRLNTLATELSVSRDQIDVSCDNLKKLELFRGNETTNHLTPFGREFLRAVSD
jgi:Abortive infection alpha